MEQRPLRLGDIVDDYCPRERRLTNHAIVAVVEDAIKQTRCMTCDADHPYKHGREPRRRTKDDLTGGQLVARSASTSEDTTAASPTHAPPAPANAAAGSPGAAAPDDDAANASTADERADAWLAHRQLIRASLPRVEGEQPPPRPIPEFTMHQRPQGRGGRPFRFGGGGGGGGSYGGGGGPERNGNVAGGHPRDGRPSGSFSNGHGHGPGGPPRGDGQSEGRSGRRRGRHKRAR
jgi:hypothetical protein